MNSISNTLHYSSRKKEECLDCSKFFNINLAGLTNNLNYQLLKCIGCEMEVETVYGTKEHGILYNFDIDFIEIKDCHDMIILLIREHIKTIHLLKGKSLAE